MSRSLLLAAVGTPTTAPDAVLNDTAITFSPAVPTVGTLVTATKSIRNAGNVRIDTGTIDCLVGGVSIGQQAIPVIAPGASASVSKSWTPSVAGSYVVSFVASEVSGSTIVESPDRTDILTLDTIITNARGVQLYMHNTDDSAGTNKSTTKVYKNGVPMTETSGLIEIAYVNHYFWQKNGVGNWYRLENDDTSWTGPTTTSPLA